MYPGRRVSVYAKTFVSLGATCLVSLSSAWAQSLVITDCQGFTRAVKRVEAGSKSNVDVQVDSTSGPSVAGDTTATLTNQVTNQVVQTVVRNGVASFEGVDAGVYALEISEPNTKVALITIGNSVGVLGAGAAIAGAAVIGGGAAVGGAIAVNEIVDQIDGGDDEGDLPPSPVPTQEPTATPVPTRTPSRPAPTPTPDDCPQCEPDLTPPPISSPFPPEELPARARKGSLATPPPRAAAQRLSPYD